MHKRVKVCVRIRPSSKAALGVAINELEKTISVITNPTNGNGSCFHFDEVLGAQADQAQVFNQCGVEVVANVMSGYNGTIMAYGQTGAGKTFTMSGGKKTFDERGICARAISSIFQQIHNDSDNSYTVRASYVEIYNEQLVDLLDLKEQAVTTIAGSGHQHQQHHQQQQQQQQQPTKELVVQEIDKGQTFIRGLTRPIVENEEQALDLLFRGDTNRTIAEHCLNASSTRSHCIFTLYIEKSATCHELHDGARKGAIVFSKLNLVDLAGSERMKKTLATGVMLKEAMHINKSLTFLEQVVIALGDKKRDHIPYRQTMLTNILKDSLGGNCRTLLIACVWPEEYHNDQSLATLKFATRMMRVKVSAVVNVAQDASVASQRLLLEIQQLKQELAMHDILTGRSQVAYTFDQAFSKRGIYQQQLEAFLDDETQRIPVESVVQVQEMFRLFRERILQERQGRPISSSSSSTCREASTPPVSHFEQQAEEILLQSQNLHASWHRLHATQQDETARSDSLQEHSASIITAQQQLQPPISMSQRNQQVPEEEDENTSIGNHCTTNQQKAVKSEKELFDEFKQSMQPDSAGDLELAKQNLKQSKKRAAQLALQVNQLKSEIDGLSLKIQAMTAVLDDSAQQQLDVVSGDISSSHLLLQLKDAKKRYREAFESFQEAKAESNYLTKVKDQMLRKLSLDFENWCVPVGAQMDDSSGICDDMAL